MLATLILEQEQLARLPGGGGESFLSRLARSQKVCAQLAVLANAVRLPKRRALRLDNAH